MRDVIWLTIDRAKVLRMTKGQPETRRGEIAVKVEVTVDADAFRPPTLVKEIRVSNPFEGIDVTDVDLSIPVITEAEAARIRQDRINTMIDTVSKLPGYKVLIECAHGDDCPVHPGGNGCDD